MINASIKPIDITITKTNRIYFGALDVIEKSYLVQNFLTFKTYIYKNLFC